MKQKIYISDSLFAHAHTTSWQNKSEQFEWERKLEDNINYIVITDLREVFKFTNKKVFGWLVEPRAILPNQYEFAKENYNLFEKIFTYDHTLLRLSPKFELLPIGGCWIDDIDRKIHEKSKLICTIASDKKWTRHHKLRHDIVNEFPEIDAFGLAYQKIDKKIQVLKDYKFCVVVENSKIDYYFTEKLIDCFITGTIPIYCGCPSIHKFFDKTGIIEFDNINDLQKILPKINDDLYSSLSVSIERNFDLAKEYVVADELLYKRLKNEYKLF